MSKAAALEDRKVQLKQAVEYRDMALRLSKNRDFKKLILEEFCVNECARYAQNSANPAFNTDSRADCLAIAQAAGHFRRFMSVITQMGDVAERDLSEIDEDIAEARREEAEEGEAA